MLAEFEYSGNWMEQKEQNKIDSVIRNKIDAFWIENVKYTNQS